VTGSRPEEGLAEAFEQQRARLTAVAHRMLGSRADAEDAVQETWLRLSRQDAAAIDNLAAWLTTVVGRVCLDALRSRRARPEAAPAAELLVIEDDGPAPEDDALLAESVGLALLVVLETLDPAERLAFVLHDLFGVPFEEIAPIVGRSSAATRQMASRARRRARQASTMSNDEFTVQRDVASAFLNAVRAGDVEALIQVLDPDVVLHASGRFAATGEPRVVQGAANVASGAVRFTKHSADTYLTLVNGAVALTWMPQGAPRSVFTFHVAQGRMDRIEVIDDPDELQQLAVLVIGR